MKAWHSLESGVCGRIPKPCLCCCRCRKIGEAGSQQLLLDTQAIKGLLLELPAAGQLPHLLPWPRLLRATRGDAQSAMSTDGCIPSFLRVLAKVLGSSCLVH